MSAPLWTAVAAAAALSMAASPSVTADRTTAAPGDRVQVRLAAWPPGNVTVELCGAAGCAVDQSVQTYVPPTGKAGTVLTVSAPPSGCPCRIRVTSLDRATTASVPITVTGTPTVAAPTAAAMTGPAVVSATVDGGTSWRARLGWPERRDLVLRLRNDATVPVPVGLSLAVGRGDDPTGFVPAPAVPDLAPGEERTVTVPVDLPVTTVGRYTIDAEVASSGTTVHIVATTERYPWALPIALALAVAALAWRLRRPTGPLPV